MSDLFYNLVKCVGRVPFVISHRPTVVGLENTRRESPFLLAANHTSPFDIALLIYHVQRHLDFVSSTEVFSIPVLGRFYGAMNAFPLNRNRVDPETVRIILQRLASGRTVAMFPEGGFRLQDKSILHGGSMRPGLGRIARIAQVPVIPCAIEDSLVYAKPASWLPLRRSRYGLAFGQAMTPPGSDATNDQTSDFESHLADRIRDLHKNLLDKMGRTEEDAATRRCTPWGT